MTFSVARTQKLIKDYKVIGFISDKNYSFSFSKQIKYLGSVKNINKIIKINIHAAPMPLMQVMGPIGMDDMTGNIQDMLSNIMPKKNKTQRLKVEDAREIFIKKKRKNSSIWMM